MAEVVGTLTWEGSRDSDGYREYKLTSLVRGDLGCGPAEALQASGLPEPGDYWIFDTDQDIWASCKENAEVKIHSEKEGDPNKYWRVTQTFSSKGDEKRCKDEQIDDPLLKPQEVSGSFAKYQEEAVIDRFGVPILNSCFEQFHGPQIEFDKNRPTIKISQNVPLLELALLAQMQDTVNDSTLWGLPARTIKLSSISWEKKFYGKCYIYYTRNFEFDVRYEGWDKELLDEGTKVLNGHWDKTTGGWVLNKIGGIFGSGGVTPNPLNPQHFIKFVDRDGNPASVILNGHGLPSAVRIGTGTGSPQQPGQIQVSVYQSANFLLLSLPTHLE